MSFPRITAVILAGGQGKRIRHLLPELPKPMAPVLGKPFIEWIMRFLALQGISRIVISSGYKADIIASHFQTHSIPDVAVSCVPESEPLGTAGGFLQAISHAPPSDAWLVCNGDSLVLTSLLPLLQALQTNCCAGALLGIPVDDASNYGTLECDAHNVIQGFAEKRAGKGLINAGVYLLRNAVIPSFPDRKPLSFETDVFPRWLSAGILLQAIPTAGPFLDIGTPETIEQAEKFIASHPLFFNRTVHAGSACNLL